MRKIKILKISFAAFISLFTEGKEQRFLVEKGFPEDARIINVSMSWPLSAGFEIAVESESFEVVPEATVPSNIEIIITKK